MPSEVQASFRVLRALRELLKLGMFRIKSQKKLSARHFQELFENSSLSPQREVSSDLID